MSDILDGLAQVRNIFAQQNMKPPTVILLESHEGCTSFALAGLTR